jgi:catechol 2,3-dioxygenase-like lactoylglutathione lyase family enzyme
MPASKSSALLSVKTIDHVTLVVKDLEQSERFYVDLLGMEIIERPAFSFPGLWFQAGATQVHLIAESPEAGPAGLPEFQGTQPSRGFHLAFEVDDCDEAAATLRKQGIDIVSGPRSRPDGPRQLYIYDPDGHLVELYSR